MSVDAIGLDARDRLIEDEDYEPELLQSDEKRLLDDEVDQIAGLLLDDGPEVLAGGRGIMQERKMLDRAHQKGKEMDMPRAMKRLRNPTFHTCQLDYLGMAPRTSTMMARPEDRILSGRMDSG